jgi:hypothetical protein
MVILFDFKSTDGGPGESRYLIERQIDAPSRPFRFGLKMELAWAEKDKRIKTWNFFFWENSKRRSKKIGTLREYPTKAPA